MVRRVTERALCRGRGREKDTKRESERQRLGQTGSERETHPKCNIAQPAHSCVHRDLERKEWGGRSGLGVREKKLFRPIYSAVKSVITGEREVGLHVF